VGSHNKIGGFLEAGKGNLESVISHQLRYPLRTAKLSMQHVLKNDEPALRAKRELQKISNIIEEAICFLDKLEVIQKLERKMYEVGEEEIDLSSFIYDLARKFSNETTRKKLSLEVKLRSGKTIVRSDPFVLENIIYNILANAVKYSKNLGRVTIEIGKQDGKILIKVLDQGIGIPRSDLDHLCSMFYRASNIKDGNEGSGLGLYIAKLFTSLIGGSLRFESEIDQGTCVFLTFPVVTT
jgi:signal transduction histidine kinase